MAAGGFRLALAGLLLAGLTVPAAGQGEGSGVSVEAGISHALPPTGVDVEASTYLAGGLDGRLRLGSRGEARARLYGGLGLQERASDWASVGLGIGWRGPLGENLGWAMDARMDGHTVGEPGVYRAWTGELEPTLNLWLGEGSLSVSGLAGLGGAEIGLAPRAPPVGPGPSTATEDLWYVGGGPTGRLPVGDLTLRLGLEAYTSAPGEYLAGTAGLSGRVGEAAWDLGAELWDTPSGAEPVGRLRVTIPLAGGWRSGLDAGRSRPDPRLGTRPAARIWAGTRRRLVSASPRPDRPLYEVVRREEWPRIRFTLPAPDADRVALVGDFTGWEPASMEHRNGLWVLERRVPPGTYHFGFMVDGRWHVPEDAPGRVEDEWGRHNATLVVPSG